MKNTIKKIIIIASLYLSFSCTKNQELPSYKQCVIISFDSKQQGTAQEQEQLKLLRKLVDISFTKTPLASDGRKETRIEELNTLAINIIDLANNRSQELLREISNDYETLYEQVQDRLYKAKKTKKNTDQTMKITEFIKNQFNKKIACDVIAMDLEARQYGSLSQSRIQQYLQEELKVLNDYYTPIYNSILILSYNRTVKIILPTDISYNSLKKFAYQN